MALYYSKIDFVGSGLIRSHGGTIFFGDPHLADYIPLTDPGHSGLDLRLNNRSLVGALNEVIDALVETSGQVNQSNCYSEGVDQELYVHDISHNLGTYNVTMQMFNADPASGPGAMNSMTCWSPIDQNTIRVELDSPASGYFVVFGCP